MTMEKMLRGIVLAGVFALPFIPLIVAQTMFFPFITGKNFTFRILVEIMAAAWLALALVQVAYRPRHSWMLWAFGIFIVAIALANAFGVNPFKSFWSNYERMEGWVTLAHLFTYFVVTTSVLTTEKLWTRLAATSLGVSVLIGVYGLMQLAGFITINQGGARLDATFGNAIYLAVYMLFHMFIAAFMWARTWASGRRTLSLDVMFGAMILLHVFILMYTETRGAMLGMIGGSFVAAGLMAFFSRKESRVMWKVSVGVVSALVVFGGVFLMVKDQAWVRDIGPLNRLASISINDKTAQARIMNWGMAWEGVKERPLLGWGQENYNIVFNENYDPGMHEQEPWFDRVHNVFFDWLIAGGFLGLFAYLSLWAVAMWYLWMTSVFTRPEQSILTGLIVAYGIHQFFVFDNLVSYMLFASLLAYLTVRVVNEKSASPVVAKEAIPRNALPVVAAVMVFVLGGAVYGTNASAIAANKTLIKALSPQETLDQNREYFAEAIAYESFGTQEVREHLTQTVMRIARNQQIPAEARQRIFNLARSEMDKQIEVAPLDARFPVFMGALLDSFGRHEEAKEYFERARELSPTKQNILFQQGINATNRGEVQEALAIFKEAHELAPEFEEPRIFYIMAAIRAGEDELAQELSEPLAGTRAAADQRIVNAYASRGDYEAIAEIWRGQIELDPENLQAYYALSAAYYQQGNSAVALETLEEAIQNNPASEAQIRQLMEEIRSGAAPTQ